MILLNSQEYFATSSLCRMGPSSVKGCMILIGKKVRGTRSCPFLRSFGIYFILNQKRNASFIKNKLQEILHFFG